MALIKQGICKISFLDGEALGLTTEDVNIKLPYLLPDEEVEFELHEYRGKKNSITRNIITSSIHRKIPHCKYFGSCGGCSLQHMSDEYYVDFKISAIRNLLDKKWHEYIESPIIIGSAVRRKAVFEVLKKDGQIFLGFHRFHSNQIVNIDSCPLLLPEISEFITPLKERLIELLPEKFKSKLSLLRTMEGLRWYINDEFNNYAESSILIDNIPVKISHDSFLQASEKADMVLQNLVKMGLQDLSGDGIDLFCGRGTFAIPLSHKYKMIGIDIETAAIQALNAAAKTYKLGLQAFTRDLFLEPVASSQLKNFAFAIINPPRAGAAAQAAELAKSGIKRIIYVSCNPKTFVADFKILEKSGYQITKITLVDQFHWSAHLEIVVVLNLVS
jgi:23S rRNA (uracil1939-C5)-methyltransferase